ncbi:MAG: nucleoside monophosphate kinase [Clostridia bacterium]|nr:nucleoside monophosphate kinase [Clostridia bacterium]
MRLILLGPVGSGKGTQAGLISARFGLPHISTGEIFRTNIKNNTELGKIAKSYIDNGELVPEELTNKLVADRLAQDDCKNGFILDGYPRNLSQAKFLETITDVDIALMIDLSEEKIIARLSSRRMCSKCSQPTSLDWMVDGKCEKCGGEVYIRDDDKPEVIKVRLQKQAVSQELIEFFKQKGVFNKIDAADDVESTYALVKNVLDNGAKNND